jgi:hypothetical protein
VIRLTQEAMQALIAKQLGRGESLLFPTQTVEQQVAVEAASKERRRRVDEATDIARYILHCLVDGYAAGEITLESYCRKCRDALAVEHVEPFVRQKLLGAAVEFALDCDPPKRPGNKGRPLWLAEVCHLIVQDIVRYEHLPMVRPDASSRQTADERAVEVLAVRGIRGMTPASVEKARAQWRAHTGSR